MKYEGQIVLASGSPRRLMLLRRAGLDVLVVPAEVDEERRPNESASELVVRLSALKTFDVWSRNRETLTLGADTVVVLDDEILGKPADLEDARRMLRELSGRSHEVLTGVTLMDADGDLDSWCCHTKVHFKELTDEVIEDYLSLVNVLDKAGSYAIQSHGEMLVEGIEGLWSNVVGLPVEEVVSHLGLTPMKTLTEEMCRE